MKMPNTILKISPQNFPPLLREIPDAPTTLYLRGNLPPQDHILLCVIGARKYSPYGKMVCDTLVTSLRNYPITIVSGLALGIDALAHKSALSAGINTVAIPGSGLDDSVLYPRSHYALAQNILKAGGALLSEYEPYFKATPWSFPKRNRIMSGMSHATLVIEATEKSGTLITARLAGEYNRDVFAVPGSIFSDSSSGPHNLIRDGATPITTPRDLKEALGFDEQSPKTEMHFENCTPTEKIILEILTIPCSRDELLEQSNLSASEVNIALSTLEIKGIIKESLGKIILV